MSCGYCEGCRWGGACSFDRPATDAGDSAGGFGLAWRQPHPDAAEPVSEAPGPSDAPSLALQQAQALLFEASQPQPPLRVTILEGSTVETFARYLRRRLR